MDIKEKLFRENYLFTREDVLRRGKLRHARKNGRDWLIPDTEDKPRRGFTSMQYKVENDAHIESDEFPLLAVCESIFIFQDEDNKNKFICYLNNHKTKFNGNLELTRSEVERLEHTIIESGKARVQGIYNTSLILLEIWKSE